MWQYAMLWSVVMFWVKLKKFTEKNAPFDWLQALCEKKKEKENGVSLNSTKFPFYDLLQNSYAQTNVY